MASQYLGKVTGLVTAEELCSLNNITEGTLNVTGDIEWQKFSVDGKLLFIADDVIRSGVSWSTLNAQGAVFGKQLQIQGSNYKCRLIKGGDTDPCYITEIYNSEWNKLLIDLVGASNFKRYTYTWCQETYRNDSANAILRGPSGEPLLCSHGNKISPYGWRPVLEFINNVIIFSIPDTDLGQITNFAPLQYSVSDANNDVMTIIEKIDGSTIRTLTNRASGTDYTLDLVSVWDSLNWGNHSIEIIADDGRELGATTVTITFDKIKEHTLPIETASLMGLIDHFENVSKDVDYEKFRLHNHLLEKGVEALGTDKLSSLIDKVANIELGKKWASGTIAISVSTMIFKDGVNANINRKYVTVTGLSFLPSLVYLIGKAGTDDSMTIYHSQGTVIDRVFSFIGRTDISAGALDSIILKTSCVVTDTQFVLPVSNYASGNFYWIAYE